MKASGTLTCPRCGTETPWPHRCDCANDKVLQAAVDAAVAFGKEATYLAHPKVSPYRGTANGDSPEAWERLYVTELCRAILAAAQKSDSSASVPSDIEDFIRHVTLELQVHRSRTPEQMDRLFQQAYALYAKYRVDRSLYVVQR